MTFAEAIAAHIEAVMRARTEKLERVAEHMLTHDGGGIMIDGDRVFIDARVPWGVIWDVTLCGADHPNLYRQGPS